MSNDSTSAKDNSVTTEDEQIRGEENDRVTIIGKIEQKKERNFEKSGILEKMAAKNTEEKPYGSSHSSLASQCSSSGGPTLAPTTPGRSGSDASTTKFNPRLRLRTYTNVAPQPPNNNNNPAVDLNGPPAGLLLRTTSQGKDIVRDSKDRELPRKVSGSIGMRKLQIVVVIDQKVSRHLKARESVVWITARRQPWTHFTMPTLHWSILASCTKGRACAITWACARVWAKCTIFYCVIGIRILSISRPALLLTRF